MLYFKKRKKMKTKSLYLIMLCAIFSGCTLPDLPSPPKSTKSKSTTITSSVLNSVSGIKVSKEYQAKFDNFRFIQQPSGEWLVRW